MYEIATKNQSTTLHIDPPGGSENYQKEKMNGTLAPVWDNFNEKTYDAGGSIYLCSSISRSN